MNIIVLLKQVVDVQLSLRVTDGALVEDGLRYVISGWDEIAIEAALQLIEEVGSGEVTLVSIGPERVKEALRKGMAMGAQKAIHINDAAFEGSDSHAFAHAFAEFLKGLDYDLILAGKQAQDTDAGLTASMLAELADLPQVTNVVKIAGAQAGKLTLHRGGDAGTEVIEMILPGVVTVNDSLTQPRFVTFRGIMKARNKPLDVLNLAGAGISADKVGVDASHTKVLRLHVPEARQTREKFAGDEAETTKQVLDLLVNESKIFGKNT